MLFDDVGRADARIQQFGETKFQFLNRSASRYFGLIRSLIEEWLSNVPDGPRRDLVGVMRKDDPGFEAAFWELYLHESYRRSGYDIEIHPRIPSTGRRPDFRISNGRESFFLEAVAVGRPPAEIAADNRLNAVQRVLQELRVKRFIVEFTHYAIGESPLATRKLRDALVSWLETLDPEEVAQSAAASNLVGFDRPPRFEWSDAGWILEFHAVPRAAAVSELERPAVGIWEPGGVWRTTAGRLDA